MSSEAELTWEGQKLGGPGCIMEYRGRLRLEWVRGYWTLVDLPKSPYLEDVLCGIEFEVELRVLRRTF